MRPYCPVGFCWQRLWVKYGTIRLLHSAGLEGAWTKTGPPLPGLLALNQGHKTQDVNMTGVEYCIVQKKRINKTNRRFSVLKYKEYLARPNETAWLKLYGYGVDIRHTKIETVFFSPHIFH